MTITTAFSPGDKVWVFTYDLPLSPVAKASVGQVSVTVTDSMGREGEEMFDNYMPQKSYCEKYMVEETGIGSGRVYTLGENIFATEPEAQVAWAKAIEEKEAA